MGNTVRRPAGPHTPFVHSLLDHLKDIGFDGLDGDEEVVCHTVFVEGMPSAFIDFDTASPGPRTRDLGYALWMFLDLGPDGASTIAQAA